MKVLILNYFEGRVQKNKLSIYLDQHILVLQLLCKIRVFLQEVILYFLLSNCSIILSSIFGIKEEFDLLLIY